MELIDSADILVEKFRSVMLDKWGMGYDSLKETNPGLIMIRISGYDGYWAVSVRPWVVSDILPAIWIVHQGVSVYASAIL